jgi:hypothetical protein
MSAGTPADEGATGLLARLVSSPGGIAVLVGLVVLGLMYGTGARRMQETGADKRSKGFEGVVEALFTGLFVWVGAIAGWIGRGLYRVLLAPVGRFLTGRETWGAARSNATWFRSGHYPEAITSHAAGSLAPGADQAAGMASEALYGPEPYDWGPLKARAAQWAEGASERLWSRRGGMPPAWASWCAEKAGALGWGLAVAGRHSVAVLGSMGGALSHFGRWPYAARAVARWWVLAVVLAVVSETVVGTYAALAVAAGAVAAVVAGATGPAGWARWAPRPVSDYEAFAPGLFEGVAPILGLSTTGNPEKEQAPDQLGDWMLFPDRLADPDAKITITLPMGWQASTTQTAALEHAIATRVPGAWVPSYQLYGDTHWVSFSHKPKPVRPEPLPEYVRWVPTGDPLRTYYGETADGPAYVLTGSATPHVGIAGETGTGKSTVAYIPLVAARLAGWLVTVIDPKQNSLVEAQGKSGVRYATEVYDCVMALAEFFVSMMAAEKYNSRLMRGKKHDHMPIPRLLIIDEMPSFKDYIAAWWKYIKKERGFPPVLVWFSLILMQGRSSDHRVFLGTHQFALEVFGSTMARDQVGTKMVAGETSIPSWAVAYGQGTPRLNYDSSIIGRGAISTKRRKAKKMLADGTPEQVEEIQFAHIPSDEINAYLDSAPQAPAWFDAGEMAPWITPEDIARADSAGAVAAFLPGGEYVTDLTPDADAADSVTGTPVPGQRRGQGVSISKEEHDQDHADGSAGTPADLDALAALVAQEKPEEVRYSLTQACTLGIIESKPGAARQKKSDWLAKGKPFPEGEVIKGVSYYTVEELHSVWGAPEGWNAEEKVNAA